MPAVCRIGDANIPHCSPMVQAQGSGNVFVNGLGVSRVGDKNTGHLQPSGSECSGHITSITSGSLTVFVNKKGCGRVGDPTCTAIAAGSSNVFAGG